MTVGRVSVRKPGLRVGLFGAFLLVFTVGAQGVIFIWDNGGIGDDWSTGQNWVGNVPPASATTTRLDFGTGSSANNDFGSFTLEEFVFESSLGSGAFTVTGNQFTFAGTTDININHTGTATIENDFTTSGNIQVFGENGGTLILSGDINPSSASGQLTKFGEHTLVLSGSNQFNGRIRIRGGIVESTNSNAIDAPRIDFEDDIGGSGNRTPTLRITTANQTYTGTLRAEGGDIGTIDVDGGLTFTVNGSGNALQWDNASSGFVKQGDGTLALEKASSGDGDLTINDGTVLVSDGGALGSASGETTVESGGSLGLLGGITITGEDLDISGPGHSGQGALFNSSGDNAYNADITVSTDATISNNAVGTTLTIGASGANNTVSNGGNTVTIDGQGDVLFNSQFSGSGGLVKNGSGTTTLFYGVNSSLSTYSGPTTVNAGTLIVDVGDVGNFTPLTGAITIGDGSGTDTLRVRYIDNIGDSTQVNVNSSGVLEINSAFYNISNAETIGALNLEGGATVQTIDGAFSQASVVLNGDVTRSAAGSATANITGRLDLGGATRTFDVADAAASSDLAVSATITNGGISKAGAGTLTLEGSSANTYTGTTTVSAGTLELNKTAGVNAIAGDIDINGGTLLLSTSNQIADTSDMTLDGGTFDTSGNSEVLGTLTLSSTSTIDLGGSGVVNFDASSSEPWSGELIVTNWDGSLTGGGSNQLVFGNSATGLDSSQVDQIRFVNPTGFAPGTYGAFITNTGEVVPVPEPATVATAAMLLATAVFHARRRRKTPETTAP